MLVATGVVRTWWVVLALPAAVLIGLAFAGAGMAAATFMRSWQDFDLIQLVVLPMFLFSTTFAPLSTYPASLQPVVQVTPLYHAIELVRSIVLGQVGWPIVLHLAYLVGLGVGGALIAAHRLERLLLR